MMTECALPQGFQTGSRNAASKVLGTRVKPEDYAYTINAAAPPMVDDPTDWLLITITARGTELLRWFTRQPEDQAEAAAQTLIKRISTSNIKYQSLSIN